MVNTEIPTYCLFTRRFETNFGESTVVFLFRTTGLAEVAPGHIRIIRRHNRMEVLLWYSICLRVHLYSRLTMVSHTKKTPTLMPQWLNNYIQSNWKWFFDILGMLSLRIAYNYGIVVRLFRSCINNNRHDHTRIATPFSICICYQYQNF